MVNELRCVDGTCRAPAEPGESCKTSFDCRSGGCVADVHGESKCGMMCSVSVSTLRALAASEASIGPISEMHRKDGRTGRDF